MNGQKDYATLVARAEEAVGAVTDTELKLIAFQKVLEDLLSAAEDREAVSIAQDRRHAVTPRSSRSPSKGKGGPAVYLQDLIDEGFFSKPKAISQVKAELENRGHHVPLTSLSGPLQKHCQARRLRRQKIKTPGKKETFSYSNW